VFELQGVYDTIARELAHQYALAYVQLGQHRRRCVSPHRIEAVAAGAGHATDANRVFEQNCERRESQ
jgi:hypothetical protein